MSKINECVRFLETVENKYKPIPFWSWNGELKKEELLEQIEWMRQTENGGFFMHARSGLKTEYLSDEWMECIEACADAAGDMQAWAYDENGWPSGFAGGKLLEREEDRDRFLTHKIGDFDPDARVNYCMDGGKLTRTDTPVPGKQYLSVTDHSAGSTADILNPAVTEKFISLTHEVYKERMGEAFAKKIVGFFTDEPQYQRWGTSYTTMVEDYFRTRYGEDIWDSIGLLFVEAEGYRAFRYRYWKAMQHLMLNNFAKKVYDWCHSNGMQFTGHYVEETSMGNQLMCCAGVMPFYEYLDIPGIDWLSRGGTGNELAPRQVGSAACQLGKEQVITESFGCCGHHVTPQDLRRLVGFQYVNGANLLCQHLIPYAENGNRKRDHPAHYCTKNPWVKEDFGAFNLYVSRLGKLLANSTEQVRVAVLHPIRSAYFDYKREAPGFNIQKQDEQLQKDCRMLSENGINYHFLDETLLEKHGFVDGKKIGCGKCSYDYLILPHILTMDISTEKLLRQYVENGGKVLLWGEKPGYLEGEPYDYGYLTSNCSFEDILSANPFRFSSTEHCLYATYRMWENTPVMVIQNGDLDHAYTQTVSFPEDIRSFAKLDMQTMQIRHIPLTLTVEAGETLILFPSREMPEATAPVREVSFALQNGNVSFTDNYLTLDTVRYSFDGKAFSHPYPCRGLFRKLLVERYEGPLYLQYEFEVQEKPERMDILVETGSVGEQWFNGHIVDVTAVGKPLDHTWRADIQQWVTMGKNTYTVKVHWHQDEQVYYALFGENVTESLRNCIVYDSEIEAIYVRGNFGVYSHKSYTDDGDYVFGEDFYIGKAPTHVTEPTVEGFPFFRGKLALSQTVELPAGTTHLWVNGTYQTATVYLNGKKAGKLMYDRILPIGGVAVPGENQVRIEFTISNRNLLGPHHCVNGDSRFGVSPYNWELEDAWVQDEKTGYRANYELLKLCADK